MNIGMLKSVTLAVLEVENKVYLNSNKKLTGFQNRELMKEASKIDPVMLIDVMSTEEIADILRKKLVRIMEK